MDKAIDVGKTSATGSFQLFIGRIVSTVILAIGTIIVGWYISPTDYGLYTIALIPAATFLLFQDWGIGSALTKYCASYRASKKEDELRGIIVSGFAFEILTGLFLTLLSLLAANFIASLYGEPQSAFLIGISSVTIFSAALSAFSISVFVGFDRMGISTVTMIITAVVQGVLSPLLVYLGFGAFGAVVGFTSASVASGATGLILLYFLILRKLPPNANKLMMFQTLKPMLRYGIPVSIAALLTGLTTQINYFAMAHFTAKAMIGNLTIASNFAVLLSFFIYPLQTVLFPAFSKLDSLNDKQVLQSFFTSSVKYSALLISPATLGLMVLSAPLIHTIYGDKWLYAPLFLALYISGNLVVLVGNLSYNRVLYAVGETRMLMKLSIVTLCIGAPLAFLLIPTLGVLGAIISITLIAPSPSLIISIYWTKKHYGTRVDFRNSSKIFLASSIAALITYLFLNTFHAASLIMLAIGALLFLFLYLTSIALVGGVNMTDTNNLRFMFSEIGRISKLLEIPLIVIEKSLKVKESRAKKAQATKNS